MANTENRRPQVKHQSPAVSGDGSRQRPWYDIRASFEEMVESCGVDPFRLGQEAQACLDLLRWPGGVRCPHLTCGSEDVQEGANREPMPHLCRRCRRPFSATSATVLYRFTLDCLQLLVATYVTVAHPGIVKAWPLAEWLETDVRTAHWLLVLIEKVIADRLSELPVAPTDAGGAPTDGGADAVVLTHRVLAVILGGDSDGARVAIAATGVEPDWHSVLPRLDPVRRSQIEPMLPVIEPKVIPSRLARLARKGKRRQPREPLLQQPDTRGVRPDQPPMW